MTFSSVFDTMARLLGVSESIFLQNECCNLTQLLFDRVNSPLSSADPDGILYIGYKYLPISKFSGISPIYNTGDNSLRLLSSAYP